MSAVQDNSRSVIEEARRLAAEQIATFCGSMTEAAKELSPVAKVKGGNNRDSIDYRASGLSGEIFTESGYGGWLEVGTSKMAARPYFRPAFEQTRQDMAE